MENTLTTIQTERGTVHVCALTSTPDCQEQQGLDELYDLIAKVLYEEYVRIREGN